MEQKILIQNLRVYPCIPQDRIQSVLEDLRKTASREIVVFPDSEQPNLYIGVLLEKYYTPALTETVSIRGHQEKGDFHFLSLHRTALRTFLQHLTRSMTPAAAQPTVRDLDDLLSELPGQDDAFRIPQEPEPVDPMLRFLQDNTPAQIQQMLDERVIGQRELTAAVADFLYYHALRQKHPQLPQRPLLIAGPSGSGKTEVWRAVDKLYGDLFQIQIIDGSNLTCDGWAGSHKISTFVTTRLAKGGILVVDEFDKLVAPKHSSSGDNVALQMQSEFLKLFEGEYHITENKKPTNVTSKAMGFVLVGAFEDLRARKAAKSRPSMGFHAHQSGKAVPVADSGLTDEDFISYGIMPEIVGRIAAKCTTQALSEEAYLQILQGPHSRVAAIAQVLAQYGIQTADVIPREELLELISHSKNNRTGVRWVCAQVENRLLAAIREQGLFPTPGNCVPLHPPLKRCS